MNNIILATEQGLVVCEGDGSDWHDVRWGLQELPTTSVVANQGIILVGAKDGIFRSTDQGQTWKEASQGLAARHVRWMAYHPDLSGLVLAGTEPANIFISHDDGHSWRACPEVAELRDRFKWSLPYSRAAGCIRSFAFHGQRVYAAVEVGGVLVSSDNGKSWQLAEGSDGKPHLGDPPEPFIYPDVHSLEVHPSSPDLVYAPTGGGFYRSNDGGRTWQLSYDCYCRAVWVDLQNSEHMILGPADGVDRNGRIEESYDGGKTWSMASTGLQVPWPRSMVERFAQIENDLFAVLSNGQVFSTPLPNINWRRIVPMITGVNAMTALERS